MLKQASNKACSSLICATILTAFFAAPAQTKSKVESYLLALDQIISDSWSIRRVQLDSYLRDHSKAVISFVIDKKGRIKKVRVKHATKETFLFGARNIYKEQAEEKLQLADSKMIEALKQSNPLPAPPKELNCPRHFVAIFDSARHARVLIDDGIMQTSQLRNTIQ